MLFNKQQIVSTLCHRIESESETDRGETLAICFAISRSSPVHPWQT